jgi:amino acid transporter
MSNTDQPTNPARRPGEPLYEHDTSGAAVPVDRESTLRHDVVEREKERFGGMKFGSAFFGWLTATGTAVLLTALVAGAGAAVGLATKTTPDDAAKATGADANTIGIVGAIAVAVVLFIAYFCGGYVAGRMARFDGLKQGLAVWIWAIVIAVVVAIVSAIAGSQFNILGNLNSFPRIPVNEGDLTVAGIITAIVVALISLAGALLGGVSGMRFHRKVDRVGLGR